ncbi:TolC family outer membrane protein [Octadecabacter sp. 1_MG-2023]|uniref:TolC family outer membrane protein n=1 Tax=unclassified Octadecabacter TaxID=196158 RepID=UPI001C0893B5|nr:MULTISPECIES: TolC family outer membrane protein [unclassified Octadecabacter]MBU2992652.1 TolC family outer membrane protein [Octadecabacter sp. B2R22]MDO6733897.1 TolC family outer membrane protein [Octadecabacter sp. 1_MG-2023]
MPAIKLITAICLMGAMLVSPARAESLADALRDSYHNSGLLDQNRALLRAADEDVAQSLAALRPIVTWQTQAVYSETGGGSTSLSDDITASASISLSLLLADGGASALATESQKELVLQTREGLVQVEQEILFRAVEAYMQVRRASEFLALRRSNVGVINQELRAARDRFEVGEVTRTDVSLAEARLAAAQSLLAAAEGDLAQANEEFRAAVGRAPGRLDVVNPASVESNIETARAFAMRRHPDVIGAQHGVASAELNIRRAQAGLQPDLTLGGGVSLDEDGDVTRQLSLTYGGTIYQGGQLQSLIRQAQARRDAARSGLLVTTQAVNQNVGNAYAILRVARASREAAGLQITASRTAFRGVREEATLGARTTLDVLNAEQELLDAQASQISAQADEVVASYRVLATMGLLTADHLNLGVQSYDPAAYYNLVREAPATHSRQGQALDRVLQSIGD